MNKSKIDWCDSTWNPVTGCLHGCEYCYARSIAHRFSGGGEYWEKDETVVLLEKLHALDGKALAYPYGFKPTFHKYRLNDYANKKGRNIFVCSMADLFGDWVSDSCIEEVFKACEKSPQHNYLFLTKNPIRYELLHQKGILRKCSNMWYGYSATKNDCDYWFDSKYNTFVSIEPILEPMKNHQVWQSYIHFGKWVIIGAETGRRKGKVIPKREWIEDIINECRKANIPVFMKESLADIWGEPLIQEFPKGLGV